MIIHAYRGNTEVIRFSITDADGNGPDLSLAEFLFSVRPSPGAEALFEREIGTGVNLVTAHGGNGAPSVVDVKIAPANTAELDASPNGVRYCYDLVVTLGDDVYTFPRDRQARPIPGDLFLHTP